MSYLRVIPRDLFNEAKLLKCLGQLALVIHDGVRVPRELKLEWSSDSDESAGFQIEQNENSGHLYVANMDLTCNGRVIGLHSPYNSKDAFPLMCCFDDDEQRVFDDEGALSPEFRAMCAAIEGGAE